MLTEKKFHAQLPRCLIMTVGDRGLGAALQGQTVWLSKPLVSYRINRQLSHLPPQVMRAFGAHVELTTGAVAVGCEAVLFAGGFRPCRCRNSCHSFVSDRRSSNRTCGFPASGFPTGFIARHTMEAFGACDEDEARLVLRTHTHARTVSCRGLAPYAVCRGSCAPDRRRDGRRLGTPVRGCHVRSTPTNRPGDGSVEFQARHSCYAASESDLYKRRRAAG